MIIRAHRRHLGLSATQVAQEAGLSIYEYGDIEQHADEVAAVTPCTIYDASAPYWALLCSSYSELSHLSKGGAHRVPNSFGAE
jgi:hypothetical protein